MKKKYAALFVSGALLISNAGLLKAESFEGRESEMNAKCAESNPSVSDTAVPVLRCHQILHQ